MKLEIVILGAVVGVLVGKIAIVLFYLLAPLAAKLGDFLFICLHRGYAFLFPRLFQERIIRIADLQCAVCSVIEDEEFFLMTRQAAGVEQFVEFGSDDIIKFFCRRKNVLVGKQVACDDFAKKYFQELVDAATVVAEQSCWDEAARVLGRDPEQSFVAGNLAAIQFIEETLLALICAPKELKEFVHGERNHGDSSGDDRRPNYVAQSNSLPRSSMMASDFILVPGEGSFNRAHIGQGGHS